MNDGLQTSTVSLNGLFFDVLSIGPEDGDLVLFLHGFPQFADAWSGVMTSLAESGFHLVALDQRGYSPGARPAEVDTYDVAHLTSDVLALAEAFDAKPFHVIGHDWGGFLAWKLAAEHPDRIQSISVLSAAHIDAFCEAIAKDSDQKARSQYIDFFKMTGHAAESYFLNNDAERLRGVYQGKVPEAQVARNVRRLSEIGALTSVLNWYRALDLTARVGQIKVPTLYIWGDHDMAVGKTAATKTAAYVDAAYQFKVMRGYSHWLLEEAPDEIGELILNHLVTFG